MSWVDYVGFLAALTVLATFCMDTILPLRGLETSSPAKWSMLRFSF
jgi:hypothetical protein